MHSIIIKRPILSMWIRVICPNRNVHWDLPPVCRVILLSKDKNGDGIIDVNDSYMDNMLPKLYFGFGNTFTWKNFDLDIFMYGQLGVKKKWNDI